LRLEQLESRVVLTAPAQAFLSVPIVSQDQLHSQGPQTITSFVGYPDSIPGATGSFDLPLNIGDEGSSFPDTGIAIDLGAKNIQLGFTSTITTTSGNVSGAYNPVLTQNYAEPTMLVQPVTFSPSNTNVTYNASNFATTTPYTAFDLAAVAKATLTYSAAASFLGEEVSTSGDTSFDNSFDLINADSRTGQLKILGASIGDGVVGGVINAGLNHVLAYPVIPPALYLTGQLSSGIPIDDSGNDLQIDGHTAPVSFKQSLDLTLVPGKLASLPGTAPTFIDAVKSASALTTYLGNQFKISDPLLTADETFPQNYATATTVQADGTLSATSSGHIADLDLAVGPQATFSFGPASLSLKALVFDLKANFDKVQTAKMTPTNMLTYAFTVPGTSTPMSVGYTLDGVPHSPATSVTFNPNVDTLQVSFTGSPIKVTPTWNFGVSFTNTFQNYASLGLELSTSPTTIPCFAG